MRSLQQSKRVLGALLVLLWGLTPLRAAPETEQDRPDMERHAALMFKLLRYDRAVARHARPVVTLGVLVDPATAGSQACGNAMRDALEQQGQRQPLARLPVRTVMLSFLDAPHLHQALDAEGVAALFVCPAGPDALDALERARASHTLTVTDSPLDYARGMMGAGLFPAGGAPLSINLSAARAQGADLEAAVLRVALVQR